jgi:hypothetical protein
MWMATREQVYHLDERCNSRFFNINEESAVWVEVGLEERGREGGREGGEVKAFFLKSPPHAS